METADLIQEIEMDAALLAGNIGITATVEFLEDVIAAVKALPQSVN